MILDGKIVRESIIENLKQEINNLENKPTLKIIVVGDNKASEVYVRNKVKFCSNLNLNVSVDKLEETITEEELLEILNKYNNDETINGLFTQLPLPSHISEQKVIETIDPKKDVDGFSKFQIGNLFLNEEGLYPCTVEAIIDIFDYYNINVSGQNITIVGRSNIVGKPLALRLINMGATVTVCNSKTKDIKSFIDNSDIFISAIGSPKYFTKDYFKDNKDLTIIDVGINRDENNKLCGDVDFSEVSPLVNNITPVPGGVGVLTVTNVCKNLIKTIK